MSKVGLRGLLPIAAGLAALACAPPAQAGTDTNSFSVSVNVISGCALNATPNLDFGNYVSGGAAATGTTTISVVCSSSTAYVLALSHGSHYSGGHRNMFNPSSVSLQYDLYTDSGYTNVWEDTTTCGTTGGSSPSCKYGTGNGAVQTYTVYGQIPSGLYPGGTGTTFTDTITVTVTY